MEEFIDIIGYEGLYQISNLGNIKSLNYRNQIGKEKILKLTKSNKGYLQLGLYKNGKIKSLKAHILVAQAFVPNTENKPQVNHKDGNKQNNCVENLEWCNNSENQIHKFRILGYKFPNNKANHLKKQINQYDKQGNFIKTWDCMMDIQRELGILQGNIYSCCKGKLKTCGGFIWKYLTT